MIVCGIDPSLTSAGVAVLVDGQPVHASHPGFPGHSGASAQSRNRRSRFQARQIRDAALSHGRPDLVVIEEHPYAIKISASEFDRAFLWGKIYETFDVVDFPRGVPIVVMNNMTAKVWITGKGTAKKPDIEAAVRGWWPDFPIANDDEADALGLAAIGAFHLGDPMPFDVKPRHTSGLEKVLWPVIA